MTIQLISAAKPRWANAAHTRIILDECVFSHLGDEVVPFLADPNDIEPHGRDIYRRAIEGEFGAVAEYVEPVVPVVIPIKVTMRQARLALLQVGLLGSVQTSIDAMTGPEGDAARIEWEYAQELRRDHPLTQTLSGSLGLSSAQLDQLFITASAL